MKLSKEKQEAITYIYMLWLYDYAYPEFDFSRKDTKNLKKRALEEYNKEEAFFRMFKLFEGKFSAIK